MSLSLIEGEIRSQDMSIKTQSGIWQLRLAKPAETTNRLIVFSCVLDARKAIFVQRSPQHAGFNSNLINGINTHSHASIFRLSRSTCVCRISRRE